MRLERDYDYDNPNMNCKPKREGDKIICTVCGRVYPRGAGMGAVTVCKKSDPTKPRDKLGDWVERQLAKIGVTPERYAYAKTQFGLPPDCKCKERKEWLNKVTGWWRGESSGQSQ